MIIKNNTITLCIFFLLCTLSCKIREKAISQENIPTFEVSNLKEFVEALGNNRKINIVEDIYIKKELESILTDTSKFLNSSTSKNWFSPIYFNEFYDIIGTYTSSVDTKESLSQNNFKEFREDLIVLAIKNVDNLIISSSNASSIILNQPDDEVIRFDSVTNFKLHNLSIFHRPETDGGCGEFAPVLTFYNSKNIVVEKCKLNGSGTEGIYTKNVENITLLKSEVFNCNKRGLSFKKSKNVKVIDCKIHTNEFDGDGEVWTASSIFYLVDSEVEVIKTSITNNTSIHKAPFVNLYTSRIEFKNCKLLNNTNFNISNVQEKPLKNNSF